MDSGASASIIHDSFTHKNKFNTRKTSVIKWPTMAGSFLTLCEAEVKIKLPELNFMAHIFAQFHITSQKSNCDIIFDQVSLRETWNKFRFPKQLCWMESNQDTHEIHQL